MATRQMGGIPTQLNGIERSVTSFEGRLTMVYRQHTLRRAFVIAILSVIVGEAMGSAEPTLLEKTLAAVRAYMASSPAPWPDAWQREYVDTIRQAITAHQAAPECAARLDILRTGFQLYWEGLKKGQDRSLFEVHQAQIRWYTEHLMGTEFPGQDERQKLRDQYRDLWDHATGSLLTQFPFLDPNTVLRAKADHLSECYRKIEAPLLPIFLRAFSAAQVEQLEQRCHDLRYARVDLWRLLGGDSKKSGEGNRDPQPLDPQQQYLLTQRCLVQLQGQIWVIVAPAPDYYRKAMGNQMLAQRRLLQTSSQARNQERRLEQERKVLQTEHLSFLLAALLETPQVFVESPSIQAQKETPLEQQNSTTNGGDTYELREVSSEQ